MPALIPGNRQRFQRRLGLPPGVSHHSDGVVADLNDFLDARHGRDLGSIEAGDRATENRAGADGGIEHARQPEIGAIDLLAVQLVHCVEPLHRLADNGPFAGRLELDLLRRFELGRGRRDLAIGNRAAGWRVGDHAVGRLAFAFRHAPFLGSGLDEHDPGRSPAFAHILVAFANATRAAGGEVAPDTVAAQVLTRGRVFPAHLGPIRLEFLSDELGETGQRALPHFRARNAHHDRSSG